MDFIGAGAQERVERAAAGAAHLGVVGVGLHLHLRHGFLRRNDHGAIGGVGDRDAIERVVVAAHRSAGDRDLRRPRLILHAIELGVAHLHDRLGELGQHKRIASQIRQVGELLAVDHLAGGGVRGVDQRGFGGDVDLFVDLAEFEREIDGDGGLRGDDDAGAGGLFKAWRFRHHGVSGWCQGGEGIFALIRCEDRARGAGAFIDDGDFGERNGRGFGVDDATAERALERLGIEGGGKHKQGIHVSHSVSFSFERRRGNQIPAWEAPG